MHPNGPTACKKERDRTKTSVREDQDTRTTREPLRLGLSGWDVEVPPRVPLKVTSQIENPRTRLNPTDSPLRPNFRSLSNKDVGRRDVKNRFRGVRGERPPLPLNLREDQRHGEGGRSKYILFCFRRVLLPENERSSGSSTPSFTSSFNEGKTHDPLSLSIPPPGVTQCVRPSSVRPRSSCPRPLDAFGRLLAIGPSP